MSLIRKIVFPGLTALMLFLLMQPYFVWGKSLMLLNYILYAIILCNLKFSSTKDVLLMVAFLAIFAVYPIRHNQNIFGLLNSVLIVFLFFTRKEYVEQSYRYFVIIMSATMAMSLIVWVLIGLGVSLPGEQIDPLNDIKDYQYIAYPFLVIGLDITGTIMNMVRFAGMFDEPGVVGTITLLILVINRFNLRKWYNVVLLIGGVLSMSLFFYIGMILYVVLAYVCDFREPMIKRFSILMVLFLGSMVLVTTPITSELIIGRLEFDEVSGKIKGDNRSDEYLDNYIELIQGTNDYYWGCDNLAIVRQFSNNAGYKNAILLYGIVFMALYMLLLGIYGFAHTYSDVWRWIVAMLIILVTLYQRPGFMFKEFIFLFMCLFRINNCERENGKTLQINGGV